MNRLDAAHLPDGKCPARTACIVSSLPQPNLLLAIEGAAVPG